MTVFIKRYLSKGELPSKDGKYIVGYEYGAFECSYNKEYSFHEEFTDCSIIEWWLEEIELPSEEEIQEVMDNLEENDNNSANDEWLAGANFILNKLKGETK